MQPTDDKREDQVCFLRTLQAFRQYSQHAKHVLETRHRQAVALPASQIALIGGVEHLNNVRELHLNAIATNQHFLDAMVSASSTLFESYWPQGMAPPAPSPQEIEPTAMDMDKVYSTMRQFVRDWSIEGVNERQSVYAPILKVLSTVFPDPETRYDKQVAVLGAGLSRLSVEIAGLGFMSQGNEFSYHMLIGGHFAMNHCIDRDGFTIHPYCDGTINLFCRGDQFRPVSIPDFTCYDHMDDAQDKGHEFGQLSMVAGDFTEVFSKPEHHQEWDVVVTCFFIDTAHNIVEYLQVIYGMLKPGGVWINAGPLLYHFSDNLSDLSLDLTYEEVIAVVKRIGFKVQNESTITTSYTNNSQSMKQMVYHCPFFWCVK